MDLAITDLYKDKETFLAPDGIAVINKSGEIIVFNKAAQRITDFKEKDILQHDYHFMFPCSVAETNYISLALNTGISYSDVTIKIADLNGICINVLASVIPIIQPSNEITGAVVVFRNVEEMITLFGKLKEKNRELSNEKNKIEAIFNSRIEGTFTINTDWEITSFNRAAENITGYLADEAIGKKCWDVFKSSVCNNGCHMEGSMFNKRPAAVNELYIQHKSGSAVPVKINSAPLYDGLGVQVGAVETFLDISEIKNLSSHLENKFKFGSIIGKSSKMQMIYELMQNAIQSDSSLLITGENGTGKEIIARAIHINSDRKTMPFTAINCSAFDDSLLESELFGHENGAFTGAIKTKPGRFELAGNGTLFLDEIGNLSPQIQIKLLRVLETREFERVGGTETIKLKARIITATNKNLLEEINAGRFREDLYFRVNVLNINIPPLRERMDDLNLLVNHFMELFGKKFDKNIRSINPLVLKYFRKYNWPGNIRELENVLEHCFVVCNGKEITIEHLPERLNGSAEFIPPKYQGKAMGNLKDAESAMIIDVLNKYNGNRQRTAEELGFDRTTLWRKMKKLGLC